MSLSIIGMNHRLLSLWIVVMFILLQTNASEALYPPSRANERIQIFEIQLPKISFENFLYFPIPEGYRYSLFLPDGTKREEVGITTDPNTDKEAQRFNQAQDNPDREAAFNDLNRFDSGPRTKNRKLSPKALQSLAG